MLPFAAQAAGCPVVLSWCPGTPSPLSAEFRRRRPPCRPWSTNRRLRRCRRCRRLRRHHHATVLTVGARGTDEPGTPVSPLPPAHEPAALTAVSAVRACRTSGAVTAVPDQPAAVGAVLTRRGAVDAIADRAEGEGQYQGVEVDRIPDRGGQG